METTKTSLARRSNAELPYLVRTKLAELRTLRDDIRVRLNLAGKEARDRWRRLEARARAAEADVRGARRDGARALAKVVEEVKRFRNRLLEKVAPISRIC